ncbi:MAG: hypothetical protein WC279_14485 [Sulfurimonas sp.]|jgi:putative NADPH-quinone reductase|uniref:hypothetical protein n=1 Tax=Sulfurimonas sp. TaxID=2022749 RepID=UPI0035628197
MSDNMTPEAREERKQSYLKHRRYELSITCNKTEEQLEKDNGLCEFLERRIKRYSELTAELASFPLNDAMSEDLIAIIMDNVKISAAATAVLKVGDKVKDDNGYGDIFEQEIVAVDSHNRCVRTYEPGIRQYQWRSTGSI